LIIGFIGQALFISQSGHLFDYEFDISHLLKKAGYICVLTGLLLNMSSIFRQAEEGEERFRGAIESLQESFAYYDSNDRLRIYKIKQPDVWTFGFMPFSHLGIPI